MSINILYTILTFCCMEFVAWSAHKYIMHGFLWSLHADHHQKDPNQFFEKNDYFFLIFATPSFLLFLMGFLYGNHLPYTWIASGIALYGFAYFMVHDIFIHQRFKWFRRSNNIYFRAIRKAHKIHHKHLGKEDGECFGMLWADLKYFREALKSEK